MKRVLVLCTGNSCRSQMAEGYLRFYAGGNLEIHSAGVKKEGINPYTLRVMEEDNIDMSSHQPRTIGDFQGQHFDYLLTICGEPSEEQLAHLTFDQQMHFSVPDPALAKGTDQEIEAYFLKVREIVKKNMLKFLGRALSENFEPA